MILQELKQQTRTYHIEIESQISILNKDLTLEQYKAILQRFWGYYVPIEARIASIKTSSTYMSEFEKRKKAPLLTNDMNFIDKSGMVILNLPICKDLPEIADVSQALGCLYVLEGSTLGGQVIARHIKEVFDFDRTRGCSFFNCYGKEVGPMWKTFGSMLTTHASTTGAEKAIIGTACETFATLNKWLVGGIT